MERSGSVGSFNELITSTFADLPNVPEETPQFLV
jgi:hypothetical protein